jgi:salicylate hydroxylase
MNADTEGPFLIVGAGIGGLATGLVLARTGREVRLLERRQDADEAGAGIQIGPNGVHLLRQWGLDEPLQQAAARPAEIRIFDGGTARRLASLPLDHMHERYGAPYLTLARSDLHRMLREAVEAEHGAEIRTGIDVSAVGEDGPDVVVKTADGQLLAGAAAIGADGLWSSIAVSACAAPEPRFTGHSASRLVFEARALEPPFSENAVGLWLGARAHLVHYPLHAGRTINVVAVVEDIARPAGWDLATDTARLEAAFSGWHPAVRELIGAGRGWRTWQLYQRPWLGTWARGRVVLLGDAAHPMLPYLAQGAVMALEDADSLARAVAAAPADIEAAFRAYMHVRQPRTRRVVETARRNGQIYHASGAMAAGRNTVLRLVPGHRLMQRFDWLYGYGC